MTGLPQEFPKHVFAELQGKAIAEAKLDIPTSSDPVATRARVAKRAAEILRKSLAERIRWARETAAGEQVASAEAWSRREEALAAGAAADAVLASWPGRDGAMVRASSEAKRTAADALKEHGVHGQAAQHWAAWAGQLEQLRAGATPETVLTSALAQFVVDKPDDRPGMNVLYP